jgi:large subunit ribosomal protein L31
MKPDIHPDYVETTVTCTCGHTFTTRSTAANGVIHADICSNCHPFYTGKQKILDTGGRVARFERRFGKRQSGSKELNRPGECAQGAFTGFFMPEGTLLRELENRV